MLQVFWTFSFLLLLLQTSADVFLQSRDASQVLKRTRRANSPFEEFRQGNQERECVEETCDREEAREIFEDEEKTEEFWNVYFDGDACESNPCSNNGQCKDGIGKYNCYCRQGFQGYNCEHEIPQFCENKNGGCDHFCHVEDAKVVCSCADGYTLVRGQYCHSDDPFKCGVTHSGKTRTILYLPGIHVPDNTTQSTNSTTQHNNSTTETVNSIGNATVSPTLNSDLEVDEAIDLIPETAGNTRVVGGSDCEPGNCPWQALLLNELNMGFCGGTILNEYFILSAAHCMNQSKTMRVVLGEFDTDISEGNEVTHEVELYVTHFHYIPETYHNDIALIKLKTPIKFTNYIIPACLPTREFAEEVLMKEKDGMISGFGRLHERGPQTTVLQKLTVPYVDRALCIESSTFKISKHMFCAGYDTESKDACQGDSGGPHVTKYKGTWFVTGVVSWGEGCARAGKYGVYTQVSKYIRWLKGAMHHMSKVRRRRDTLHNVVYV